MPTIAVGAEITDVTPSTAGAQLTIAEDGGSIWYTAPEDFSGTDTFVYTVDGALKAEVQVQVRAEGESLFPVFETLADYEKFLIDDAVQRYEYLFGQPAWYWYGWDTDLNGGPEAPPDAAGGRDHSETNVQVAGVDEGDIVEFDSDYVYMLTGQDLVILDAWPATELAGDLADRDRGDTDRPVSQGRSPDRDFAHRSDLARGMTSADRGWTGR